MSPPPPSAILMEAEDDTTGIYVPDVLNVDSIQALRTKQGKLLARTAARADVELFKGLGRHAAKPKAKRWDRKPVLSLWCY